MVRPVNADSLGKLKTYEARFLIANVRRNDLGAVVSAVHSAGEPYTVYGCMCVTTM